MAETIQFLYSQFLMRDLLGYALPGAIVAVGLLWVLWPQSLLRLTSKDSALLSSTPAWLLAIAFAYMVGHSVAGLAFNVINPNPVFSYYPSSQLASDIEVSDHRTRFYAAAARLPEAEQRIQLRQRERHVVLKHVTGTSSAAVFCVFAAFVASSVVRRRGKAATNTRQWLLSRLFTALLIFGLGFGWWIHHRRLVDRQYWHELGVIENVGSEPDDNQLTP